MHCNEVLHACRVDPIYCDIFGHAERVLIYGQPINLRYIHKRLPALLNTPHLYWSHAAEAQRSEARSAGGSTWRPFLSSCTMAPSASIQLMDLFDRLEAEICQICHFLSMSWKV